MERDFKEIWRKYPVDKIPTKEKLPDYLYRVLEREGVKRILDIGCGIGKFSIYLFEKGYSVIGVDINGEAIEAARLEVSKLPLSKSYGDIKFLVGDATDLELNGAPFDAILMQLVISIIGNAEYRKRLIKRGASLLRPGGILYFSASGVSDQINPGYAEIYEKDLLLTGERYTYFSRDEETGEILYMTHHFTQKEIEEILREDFDMEIIRREKETSSRRPNEAACFFYVIAKRKFYRRF